LSERIAPLSLEEKPIDRVDGLFFLSGKHLVRMGDSPVANMDNDTLEFSENELLWGLLIYGQYVAGKGQRA
jgi:hypothetical protein